MNPGSRTIAGGTLIADLGTENLRIGKRLCEMPAFPIDLPHETEDAIATEKRAGRLAAGMIMAAAAATSIITATAIAFWVIF